MITAKTQVAAKVEVTEGTAETLTAAEAILASGFSFKPSIETHERPNTSSSLSKFSSVAGARSAVIEFDVEIKGSGAAGTPPALGTLLKGCGFGVTTVGGASNTYAPISTAIPSLTVAGYVDGVCRKIWGARGNVQFKLKAGSPGSLHFTFTGADFTVTDVALLAAVTYESTIPPAFLSAALLVDSYAALLDSLTIDMGNKVALRKDANTSSGHKSAVITGRAPKITFDPEFVLVAAYDFYGKWRSSSQGALTLALTGSAGNICTITAPKVQYAGVSDAEREGIQTVSIDGRLNRSAGDDEISIAFT